MRTILIDKLIKDTCYEETSVTINSLCFKSWQIAKPLNYTKQYTTFFQRLKMAFHVLSGKAIATSFFSDLSLSEKIAYLKSQS